MLYQDRSEHCESERSHHGGDQAYGQKQGDDDGCHSKGDQEPARKARYRDLSRLSKRQHTGPPRFQRRQLGRSISAYDDNKAVTGDKRRMQSSGDGKGIPNLWKTGSNWNTVTIAAQEIRKKLPHFFQAARTSAEATARRSLSTNTPGTIIMVTGGINRAIDRRAS
jgi:hypothetical protein